MYDWFTDHFNWIDSSPGEHEKEIQIYLAIHRAFPKSDESIMRYNLLLKEFPGWKDADMSEGYTTDSSIRRLIRNIGAENIEDLVKVRICDRIGSGVPKAVPYRLRHFQYRVEKIIREHEAVSVGMLKVNGEDIKKLLGVPAGPKIGHMLQALLEEVLDEPKKNVRELLLKRIEELNKMSETELIELRKKAEERVELIEESRDKEIKKKYWVK